MTSPTNHEMQLFNLLRVMTKNKNPYHKIPTPILAAMFLILTWLTEEYTEALSIPERNQ